MGDEETSRLKNRPQVSSPVAPMVPVAEEHRRLFGYRPPNNSRASSSTSSRNRKQPAPKCHVVATSTRDRISIPIPNTQTKTFVCLEKEATTAPSTFEKVSMVLAGLEEKSIFFFERGNSQHVHEKIWGFSNSGDCRRVRNSENRWKGKSSAYGVIHTTWWVYCIVP